MKASVFCAGLLCVMFAGYGQSKDSTKHAERKLPWFVERFKISAGAFYVINKSNLQIGTDNQPGTDISLEKDLGFQKEVTTVLANAQWQISPRSRLTLNYYNIKRSSETTLKKDIVYEGTIYPVNSSVKSFFNTAIYQVSYGYAIVSKPTYEIGLFIGSHIVGGKAGLSASAQGSGTVTDNNFGFTAPLPDLGIWTGIALSKKLAMNADLSYFALTLDNKTGRLLSFNLAVTYKLYKQLDLTLGYTGLDFKLKTTDKDFTGNFKWSYNGPALAVNFSFGRKTWSH